MLMMEKEVTAEEIVFEGEQLVLGRIYTIRIRDVEVKIHLKRTFSDGRFQALKASIQNSPIVISNNSHETGWLDKILSRLKIGIDKDKT